MSQDSKEIETIGERHPYVRYDDVYFGRRIEQVQCLAHGVGGYYRASNGLKKRRQGVHERAVIVGEQNGCSHMNLRFAADAGFTISPPTARYCP